MARVLMSGAEAGHLGVLHYVNDDAAVSAAEKAHGDYSYYLPSTYSRIGFELPAAATELYVQFRVYAITGGGSGYGAGALQFLDNNLSSVGIFVLNPNVALSYHLRYTSTPVGTGGALPQNEWALVELYIKPANSGGIVTCKLNGVQVFTFTGDTTDAGENVRYLRFGNFYSSGYTEMYIDDIIVNDASGAVNNSWPGGAAIYALIPNGAGTTTELTPSAGANYECVDDIPPDDDTSYVESYVQDEIDTYAMSPSVGAGTIGAVQWLCRAKANSAGTTEVARVLRVNGTDYVGSDIGVGESYGYAKEILESNPDDSAAWESADLDALEAGLKVR